ncbi:MAG: hypothetical protein ACOCSP_02435 [archaeon]
MVEANDLIGSLFRTLLKNAVRHGHGENPRVTVTANEEDVRTLVRVADSGQVFPTTARRRSSAGSVFVVELPIADE